MKRGGRPVRRTPLQAHAPLRRTKPLAAGGRGATALPPALVARPKVSRPAPAVPDEVRAVVAARSGGVCELRLPGCWGRASQVHHRITRKAGGRKGAGKRGADRVSNLVHACAPCHGWVTDRPKESYGAGWSLREGSDPAGVAIVFGFDLVYLDDAGGLRAVEAVGA